MTPAHSWESKLAMSKLDLKVKIRAFIYTIRDLDIIAQIAWYKAATQYHRYRYKFYRQELERH